jgi:hypothetical protein
MPRAVYFGWIMERTEAVDICPTNRSSAPEEFAAAAVVIVGAVPPPLVAAAAARAVVAPASALSVFTIRIRRTCVSCSAKAASK